MDGVGGGIVETLLCVWEGWEVKLKLGFWSGWKVLSRLRNVYLGSFPAHCRIVMGGPMWHQKSTLRLLPHPKLAQSPDGTQKIVLNI